MWFLAILVYCIEESIPALSICDVDIYVSSDEMINDCGDRFSWESQVSHHDVLTIRWLDEVDIFAMIEFHKILALLGDTWHKLIPESGLYFLHFLGRNCRRMLLLSIVNRCPHFWLCNGFLLIVHERVRDLLLMVLEKMAGTLQTSSTYFVIFGVWGS